MGRAHSSAAPRFPLQHLQANIVSPLILPLNGVLRLTRCSIVAVSCRFGVNTISLPQSGQKGSCRKSRRRRLARLFLLTRHQLNLDTLIFHAAAFGYSQ